MKQVVEKYTNTDICYMNIREHLEYGYRVNSMIYILLRNGMDIPLYTIIVVYEREVEEWK